MLSLFVIRFMVALGRVKVVYEIVNNIVTGEGLVVKTFFQRRLLALRALKAAIYTIRQRVLAGEPTPCWA